MKNNYSIDEAIYNKKSILEAIDDFSEVGKIEYIKGKLIIHGDVTESEEIFNEIMNYIIGIQV